MAEDTGFVLRNSPALPLIRAGCLDLVRGGINDSEVSHAHQRRVESEVKA